MANKKGITISKIRTVLYTTAKILGDVQAISSKDPNKIKKRFGRRILGKITGRMMGKFFK